MATPTTTRPILGFGPVGWIASAALAAIAAAAIAGVDMQTAYLTLLARLTDGGFVVHYVARVHLWHGFSLSIPEFSLISLLYVLPALHLSSRPVRWWALAAALIWAIVRPLYWFWDRMVFDPISMTLFDARRWSIVDRDLAFGSFELVTVALLLLLLTRSWRVAVAAAVATAAVTFGLLVRATPGFAPLDYVMTWTWHAAIAVVLLVWAVSARRRLAPHLCQACGYDLRGTSASRCAECGATRDRPVAG